jgi:hypothetical protein
VAIFLLYKGCSAVSLIRVVSNIFNTTYSLLLVNIFESKIGACMRYHIWRLSLVSFATLLLFSITTLVTAAISFCTDIPYVKYELQKYSKKINLPGYESCQQGMKVSDKSIIVACYDKNKTAEHDSTLRFLMVDNLDKKPIVKFKSKNFGDSDYMRISVFRCGDVNKPLIVLAEVGADFSYGIEVFQFDGLKMRHLGYLDVSVDGIDNPVSAVPYVKISETNNLLVFSFTKDLFVTDKRGKYKTIPKNKIKYVYKNGKLIEIINGKISNR